MLDLGIYVQVGEGGELNVVLESREQDVHALKMPQWIDSCLIAYTEKQQDCH